jgi:hypothetical protein
MAQSGCRAESAQEPPQSSGAIEGAIHRHLGWMRDLRTGAEPQQDRLSDRGRQGRLSRGVHMGKQGEGT